MPNSAFFQIQINEGGPKTNTVGKIYGDMQKKQPHKAFKPSMSEVEQEEEKVFLLMKI